GRPEPAPRRDGRLSGAVDEAAVRASSAGSSPLRRALRVVVPAWFLIISAMRLSVLLPTTPGYDGMLYREAAVRWLPGAAPWAAPPGGPVSGAPPPTLLVMVPFALLPESVARVALGAVGIIGRMGLVRPRRLPGWWLAFPPLVDGVYIANPHVWV